MLINSAALRSLYTGFSAAFQTAFSNVKPLYSSVAMTVPSSTSANEYGWIGSMPRFREWVGDRVINSLSNAGYTLKNKDFEMTIGVGRNEIEDDNLGIYGPMFSEMGRAAASFPDELVFQVLKTGFAANCFDGQYFFDTDHPVLAEDGVTVNSVSNSGGGAGTNWFLMDTSRMIKPLVWQLRKPFDKIVKKDRDEDDNVFDRKEYRYGVDGRANVGFGLWQLAYGSKQTLDAAAYEAARAAMGNFKADGGRPLGIIPNLLIVPPALEGAGRKILQSQLVNGGESNPWAGTAQLLVVPWL